MFAYEPAARAGGVAEAADVPDRIDAHEAEAPVVTCLKLVHLRDGLIDLGVREVLRTLSAGGIEHRLVGKPDVDELSPRSGGEQCRRREAEKKDVFHGSILVLETLVRLS